MKPMSAATYERISVPLSIILPIDSSPSEKKILSRAVGTDLKVLSTLFASNPFSNGVYRFGSKVSVCAIPPAIKSRITESAVEGNVGEPHDESNPAKGAPIPMVAMAAALVFLRKSRRLWRVFIV